MNRIIDLIRSSQFRYLLAGLWNTIFGYGLMVSLYDGFKTQVHILILSAICNLISISMSFLTYKLYVFRTQGNWLAEWLRSFVVYGGAAVLSTALLWGLVDFVQLNIYISQALAIIIVVVISYLGHSKFTFKIKEKLNRDA